MPDLNSLLRWSIENSTAPQTSNDESTPDQPLSLRFNPTSQPHSANSALHPSDPLYRAQQNSTDDDSPLSTPGPETPITGTSSLPGIPRRSDLTSEMLDVILGKGDSVIMKEKIEFALDESQSVEQRCEALDDFEMLIEMIDNANNISSLKLWDPILSLLSSPESQIVAAALWIIGTAVQNNLKAQAALYTHNALPQILSRIFPSSSSDASPTKTVRARATYALSSSLKHWPLASTALSSNSSLGYSVLKRGVVDEEPVIRRKMAFMIGTLVMQSGEKYEGDIPAEVQKMIEENQSSTGKVEESLVEGLAREGVFGELLRGLKEIKGEDGEADLEYEENAFRALVRGVEKGGLTVEQKMELRGIWEERGALGQEERGLGGEDGKEISRILA